MYREDGMEETKYVYLYIKKIKIKITEIDEIESVTDWFRYVIVYYIICPSRSFTPKRMKNEGFPGYVFFCYPNVHFVIGTYNVLKKKYIANNAVVTV